ncbi:unnamed protein product, partial [Didymodactylos carnosus]
MVSDDVMYECIDHLLEHETADRQSFECCQKLLNRIGDELKEKANEDETKTEQLTKYYQALEQNEYDFDVALQ